MVIVFVCLFFVVVFLLFLHCNTWVGFWGHYAGWACCVIHVNNNIATQMKIFRQLKCFKHPGSLCYRPFCVGGPGVIILCVFVIFTTGRFMFILTLFSVIIVQYCLAF